jgi:hypothetical protein
MTKAIRFRGVLRGGRLAAYLSVMALALACVPRERPGQGNSGAEGGAGARVATLGRGAAASGGSGANIGRTPAPAPPEAAENDDPWLETTFSDDFERSGPAALGPNWRTTSNVWRIDDGKLCVSGAKNHPAWLARRLPVNATIEFLALSESPEGDIKAEFWGDGRSSAAGQSYTDATSYLTIFGGWKNRFHVLARLDEHAPDRQEIKLEPGAADLIRSTVEAHRVYQFRVERRDGHTVRWSVDGVEISSYPDDEPLRGPGHEHFGFNDWQVRVCFDNLRVTPLED